MKYISLISILFFFAACDQQQKLTSEEVKEGFGGFNIEEQIKIKAVDVSKTPIYKKVEHHPEDYEFLNEVEIFRMLYNSDGLMVTGFVVKPKNASEDLPVVIFNRGGNQEYGHLLVAHAVEIFAPLAAQGYIVAGSNYRGNSGSEGQEEFGGADVADVPNLIDALGHLDGVDNSRVGIFGVSRGGMMAYLTMKNETSDRLKCVATLGGITDMQHTIEFHPEIGEVCNWLVPDFESNRTEAIISRSAVYWVDQLSAKVPILILHGTADKSVDYDQIPVFADSLDKYDVPYKFISYVNDNHGCVNHKDDVMGTIIKWMDAHLKEGNAHSGAVRLVVED
ncbi:MAG: prolyl oligopeptidase family serine peptidase [Cyclobacteriaceae bacterium]